MHSIAELEAAVAEATRRGHRFVQLIVERKRAPAGETGRLWPGGPSVRFVGEIRPGRWLVDVDRRALRQAIAEAMGEG